MNEQTRITVDGGENRGGWVKNDSRGKIFINQSNLYRSGCTFGRELTLLMSIITWLSLCVGVDLLYKSLKSKHFNISERRGRREKERMPRTRVFVSAYGFGIRVLEVQGCFEFLWF